MKLTLNDSCSPRRFGRLFVLLVTVSSLAHAISSSPRLIFLLKKHLTPTRGERGSLTFRPEKCHIRDENCELIAQLRCVAAEYPIAIQTCRAG